MGIKTYVTFGQVHRHEINGQVFDKDCVAVVDGDREEVFRLFGPWFCFEYPEDQFDHRVMIHFPRGLIPVPSDG